ncbi:transporter [Virgibacillus sp. C22-A2]|uniref:Transporter n=2 Tax=Virgibacillus tibetensis TaxID=3042313 RepID=A0ABU6KIC4_9BACI|nr:transporter [Virgibacillus sp. C22-A2]
MKIVYEGTMILLVMLTIITIWSDNTYNATINWVVWIVFVTDFTFRLITASKKWNFIKQNPFLLLAIIPFDQFFQMARIVRVIYFFRIKTITKYYVTPYIEKLTYRSLTAGIAIILLLLVIKSFVIWSMEDSVNTHLDSLYVVFGHLLFFGHQIFVIESPLSIWLLTGTSIIGVVIQGLALQWFFTKIEKIYSKRRTSKAVTKDLEKIN